MDGPEPGSRGWLVWLDEPGLDRSTVGGKGESLNRLIALGAPVPAACAITAAAWREASDALGLPDRVDHLATSDCERIRERILTAPLPAVIHAAIAAAWRALEERVGSKPILAVRSSGVAEDSPARSFAGLHDTVLDVRSPGMLDAAVRQCWASLWSERAVAYRRDHDIAGDGDAMAVVIQQLVRSDISFRAYLHRTR
jgi:pyruvate,water dikinase